jgi:glycosyltransferase involved in cell wall biosynthesis
MTAPLVSVGMPLYRSMRYLDIITRNIEAIDYANVEIILSDRHGFDDTLEKVSARFPGDKRLRFIAATDKIGWVDNYNVLLKEALGDYFFWVSHDDFYPAGFIPELVSCLETEPDVLIAYPRPIMVDVDDRPISWQPETELLLNPGEAWSPRVALRQLIFSPSLPMKGMFRRKQIVNAGLYMRSPLDTILADVYWVFATGLLGRPRFVPSAHLRRRVDPTSTSAQWQFGLRHVWSGYAVLCSYIRDFAPGRRAAAEALAVVSAWSMARAVAVTAERWPVPLRGRGLARKLLARVLSAPVGPSGLP